MVSARDCTRSSISASIAATGIVRSGSSTSRRWYVFTMLLSVSQGGNVWEISPDALTRNVWLCPPEGYFQYSPFWSMLVGYLSKVVVLYCLRKVVQLLEYLSTRLVFDGGTLDIW